MTEKVGQPTHRSPDFKRVFTNSINVALYGTQVNLQCSFAGEIEMNKQGIEELLHLIVPLTLLDGLIKELVDRRNACAQHGLLPVLPTQITPTTPTFLNKAI